METFAAKLSIIVVTSVLALMFLTGIGNPQKDYQRALSESHKKAMDQVTSTPRSGTLLTEP